MHVWNYVHLHDVTESPGLNIGDSGGWGACIRFLLLLLWLISRPKENAHLTVVNKVPSVQQ